MILKPDNAYATVAGIFAVIALGCLMGMAQDKQDKPVQFVMSQMESLQLDKLKLESEVISLRKQLAEAQLSCTNASFHQELSNYTAETLKAHGNPDGVTLDLNTLSWKVQEKKH